MLHSYRLVALTMGVGVVLFLILRPSKLQELSPLQYLKLSGKVSPAIFNRTLGVSIPCHRIG